MPTCTLRPTIRALSLSVIALCAVAPPVAAQLSKDQLEQREDAVKDFKRFFRKFKEPAQKVEAVHTLAPNECVAAAEQLVGLFDHKLIEIRRAAVDVLSGYEMDQTFAALIEALPDTKPDRQAVLIDVFGRAKIQSAGPAIDVLLIDEGVRQEAVRFACARALVTIRSPRVAESLKLLLDDGSATVRMAACDTAGILDVEEVGPRLLELLDDSSWQVQLAAAQACGKVRVVDAVDRLIEILGEGGRVVEEAADALFHITGFDLGTDAASWRKTWDRYSAIESWRIPTDEELAKKAASRKRYDALYGKTDKANSFGGIKTTSTQILFIIDISGSMDDLVVQREKFDADYKDFKKLTIVKTELARTIETLDGNTEFNIAAFATEVKPWKKWLVPANNVNKAAAVSWIRKLDAIGGKEAQALAGGGLTGSANLSAGKTNTHAALLWPFGIDPEKARGPITKRKPQENDLDTVYFLSDGRPSVGKLVDEREILRDITEVNEAFRITFHVLAIGDFQKAYLKDLARLNHGLFVDLGR